MVFVAHLAGALRLLPMARAIVLAGTLRVLTSLPSRGPDTWRDVVLARFDRLRQRSETPDAKVGRLTTWFCRRLPSWYRAFRRRQAGLALGEWLSSGSYTGMLRSGRLVGAMCVVSGGIILETQKLTKEFAGFVAVSEVHLRVTRGTIPPLTFPSGPGPPTCVN